MRQKTTSFHISRLYSGEKLLGHVIHIFEVDGKVERAYPLRNGLGLAVFETCEEAIAAADSLRL
jgi:hypothetical protein